MPLKFVFLPYFSCLKFDLFSFPKQAILNTSVFEKAANKNAIFEVIYPVTSRSSRNKRTGCFFGRFQVPQGKLVGSQMRSLSGRGADSRNNTKNVVSAFVDSMSKLTIEATKG